MTISTKTYAHTKTIASCMYQSIHKCTYQTTTGIHHIIIFGFFFTLFFNRKVKIFLLCWFSSMDHFVIYIMTLVECHEDVDYWLRCILGGSQELGFGSTLCDNSGIWKVVDCYCMINQIHLYKLLVYNKKCPLNYVKGS